MKDNILCQLSEYELLELMEKHLKGKCLYKPVKGQCMEDTISDLCYIEFDRIKAILCVEHSFDEERYEAEGDGEFPFDDVRGSFEEAVECRVDNSKELLKTAEMKRLEDAFHELFATNHICIDLMELIPEKKLRKYIIKQMLDEVDFKKIKEVLQ